MVFYQDACIFHSNLTIAHQSSCDKSVRERRAGRESKSPLCDHIDAPECFKTPFVSLACFLNQAPNNELPEILFLFIRQKFHQWHQTWLINPFDHSLCTGKEAVGIFTPHPGFREWNSPDKQLVFLNCWHIPGPLKTGEIGGKLRLFDRLFHNPEKIHTIAITCKIVSQSSTTVKGARYSIRSCSLNDYRPYFAVKLALARVFA